MGMSTLIASTPSYQNDAISRQRATRSVFSRSGRIVFLVVLLISGWSSEDTHGNSPADELVDLTGGVIPLLTYDMGGSSSGGGQLFSGGRLSSRGEVHYLVQVKNQTGDPIEADSLIVVVHHIQEMARLRDMTTELDIRGADGYTDDGKPYFRVPVDGQAELPPYGESEWFPIEIKNPDLLRLSPPVLRVRGVRKTTSQAFQETLQTLIRKGVVTPEEAQKAMDQSH